MRYQYTEAKWSTFCRQYVYFCFQRKCIISIKMSLKRVHGNPVDTKSPMIRVMAWCRTGDKPLPEPMEINQPTHIYVSRPQWVDKTSPCGIWCPNIILWWWWWRWWRHLHCEWQPETSTLTVSCHGANFFARCSIFCVQAAPDVTMPLHHSDNLQCC